MGSWNSHSKFECWPHRVLLTRRTGVGAEIQRNHSCRRIPSHTDCRADCKQSHCCSCRRSARYCSCKPWACRRSRGGHGSRYMCRARAGNRPMNCTAVGRHSQRGGRFGLVLGMAWTGCSSGGPGCRSVDPRVRSVGPRVRRARMPVLSAHRCSCLAWCWRRMHIADCSGSSVCGPRRSQGTLPKGSAKTKQGRVEAHSWQRPSQGNKTTAA